MSENKEITVPMAAQRDIKMVTTEIRTITRQAQGLLLSAAVEIGRRLQEAKTMVPYGDWGRYLKEEVEFSQSTAQNFMKLAEEYGDRQESLFSGANSQTLGNLTYSKALQLLAVPAAERAEFAEEHDVEALSTRELEKLIRERDDANNRAAKAEEAAREAGEQVDKAAEMAARAEAGEAQAKRNLEKAQAQAADVEKKAADLQAKLGSAREAERAAKKKLAEIRKNPTLPVGEMEKIRAEAEAAAAKNAEERLCTKLEKMEKRIARAEQAKAEAEAALENARKQAKLQSPEAAAFKSTFDRAQEELVRLQDALKALKEKDPGLAGKMEMAVRAMLEIWMKRVEG